MVGSKGSSKGGVKGGVKGRSKGGAKGDAKSGAKRVDDGDTNSSLEKRAKQLTDGLGDAQQTLVGVQEIFDAYLASGEVLAGIRALNAVNYLESVLWPCVADSAAAPVEQQKALVLSVLLLANEKLRSRGNSVWSFLSESSAQWEAFVALLLGTPAWSTTEKLHLVQFLIYCYQSLDVSPIAKSFLKLTSLPMWSALSPTQRQIEFEQHPKLERHWMSIDGGGDEDVSSSETVQEKPTKRRKTGATRAPHAPSRPEKEFIVNLICEFLELINEPIKKSAKGPEVDAKFRYTALFLAFVSDLLYQLPTRRFLHVVLRRMHFLAEVRKSSLITHCLEWRSQFEIAALKKQLSILTATMRFAIDAHTGKSFNVREQRELVSKQIQVLQQTAFQEFRNTPLEDLAIVPVSTIADGASFAGILAPLVNAERGQVNALAVQLGVVRDIDQASSLSEEDLVGFFVDEFSVDRVEEWLEVPAYPTELEIWSDVLGSPESSNVYGADDSKLVPILPLRKPNLQFLNVADYLQRNYELFRLDAVANIRVILESAITPMDAVRSLTSASAETVFRGFSRMATPLSSPLKIVHVSKPSLGKTVPGSVVGQFEIELDSRQDAQAFDHFTPKEVVFLITLRATNDEAAESMGFASTGDSGLYFPEQHGVLYVRGAEVVEVADGYGTVIGEGSRASRGRKRTLKVVLDGVQYKSDVDAGRLEAYEKVNILVRCKAGEGSFKAVLDAITSAHSTVGAEDVLPSWLHDLFLGYGDPSAATFKTILKQRQQQEARVQLLDLVVDAEHVLETCFDGTEKRLVDADDEKTPLAAKDAIGPFTYVQDVLNDSQVVHARRMPAKYQPDSSSGSAIRFDKPQVAAVRSGMCEGLTVVVGEPGGRRTDVAAQLVLNLYRTAPLREKVLVVAHSSSALDAITRRILERKLINESELVCLDLRQSSSGTPENDLSESGRVNFVLQRRLELLKEVEYMAKWLESKDPTRHSGLSDSAGYSCENALIFYEFHVRPLLDTTRSGESTKATTDAVLNEYFAARNGTAPGSRGELLAFAATLDAYFGELQRLQSFELLQTPKQRGDLYLIQHARIVTMTCKQAAASQSKLASLGLTFGSFVVEEADRVSEVDSLVPLLLVSKGASSPRGSKRLGADTLKRVVLLGDERGSVAATSEALRTYAHVDQSLFARLLRLDVPRVDLGSGASKSSRPLEAFLASELYAMRPRTLDAPAHLVDVKESRKLFNFIWACIKSFQ